MKLIDSLRLVWRNLWRMKLRTILTSIGVMIGTAAIVAMISLSIGLQENAVKSLENWGNLTEMEVQQTYWTPDGERIPDDEVKQLNKDAVQELKQIPGVVAAMPTKRSYASVELAYGRLEGYIELLGVDVWEAESFKGDEVERGEFLSGSPNEILISADVVRNLRDEEKERREQRFQQRGSGDVSSGEAVMMYDTPMYMGGSSSNETNTVDLVGQTVTLVITRHNHGEDGEVTIERKELRAHVVGQLEKSDDWRYSGVALVPLELLNEINQWAYPERMDGERQREDRYAQTENVPIEYDNIIIKVASREVVEDVVNQVLELGYETYSPARALQEINSFFLVIKLILGGIGAISLLVATIGIINTMIMSILERTREIGIMKVIGATVYNIRWLFLVESGTIGMIGGLTGLGLAAGAVSVVNFFYRQNPEIDVFGNGTSEYIAVIPMWLALFAIGFSILIGLIAGLYPAFRASRLSPLQAIRSE